MFFLETTTCHDVEGREPVERKPPGEEGSPLKEGDLNVDQG